MHRPGVPDDLDLRHAPRHARLQGRVPARFPALHTDARTIYLAGDIIDGWRLRKSWYWPQSHNDIVQETLRKVRNGTRVIYVPGNHDEWLRDYVSLHFGGIEVVEEAVHVTADGRRLLVIHGDWFDLIVKNARWLALLGDTRLHAGVMGQPSLQPGAPLARLRLLVAVGFSEAAGQERGAIYRVVRRGIGWGIACT